MRLRTLLLPLIILLLPQSLLAAWELTPTTVAAGDVAVLRWHGPGRPDSAVGRFADTPFYLETAANGDLFALIGVDIEQAPGVLMVTVIATDRQGQGRLTTLPLQVIVKDRGVDRLTLSPEMVTPKAPAVLERIARDNALLRQLFGKHDGKLMAEPFRAPVTDPVSSHFGKKRILNGKLRSPHSGTDFRSPAGRPVRSPARGRVVYSGELYYTGRTVVLDHGAGLYSLYAHLLSALVQKGELLAAGQVLGKVGSTGRSTGAHLHWTVRLRNARIDPLTLLQRYGAE